METVSVQSWQSIMEYIIIHCPEIHKLYSIEGGYCYLTARNGSRYKITNNDSQQKILSIIDTIRSFD